MMLRTHLAIVVLAILLFLPSVSSKFIFIITALITTLIPDIDSGFSTIGRLRTSRIVHFLVRHRGILHSFTFCIVISLVFAFYIPVLTLPFFLAYALHLFADSFTIDGIRPFWPLRATSSWRIRTGSYTETSLFITLLLVDILVFVFVIKDIF